MKKLCLISLVLPSFGFTLEGNFFEVELVPNRAYTIATLSYDNFYIVENSGSCQGTVVRTGGIWYGSCHGGEVISEVSLFVNGQEVEISETTYEGEHFRFEKISLLGNFAELHSVIIVNDCAIREVVDIILLQPTTFSYFYPFLSSHNDDFIEFAGIVAPGTVLYEGLTDLGDSSFSRLYDVNMVGQFDPIGNVGVAVYFTVSGIEDEGYPFIWDRGIDNKLYFAWSSYLSVEYSEGTEWHFETTRYPIFSLEDVVSPLFGDYDKDGDIDEEDLGSFLNCMNGPNSSDLRWDECYFSFDIDGDNDIDLADFSKIW